MSALEFRPVGLFEPVSWRKSKWTMTRAVMINGRMKWKVKNRDRVALSTENPPQIHSTRVGPIYGIADNKFVITVAPQKDICPHGRTYPRNAVAIIENTRRIPIFQVSRKV